MSGSYSFWSSASSALFAVAIVIFVMLSGQVRGRGRPPRNAVLERHLGPERYAQTFAPRVSDLMLANMEAELDIPIEQVISEAEEAEVARQLRIHGPENAPPRPRFPVEWCEREGGHWTPLGTFHSHRGDPPPKPPPPLPDRGELSWR